MKKCVLFLICCLLIVSSAGCSKSKVAEYPIYDANASVSTVPSKVLASNANYELSWDETAYCVMLKDLTTGKIWSNIPYEYLLEGGSSANVNSTINITAADVKNLSWETYRGYTDAVESGKVSAEQIENGIRVTYYFDNIQISVPVEYVLNGNALEVTVDIKAASEGDKFKLLAVSVAPFLCSASNDNEGSYLLVPSGSGALMYTTEDVGGTRKYTGDVYSTDPSRILPDVLTDNEPIRLPVFGVKNGDSAMFCVMKDGAESAVLEAEAGNSRTGYSTVYPTYYVRGYDTFATDSSNSKLFGSEYSIVSTARSEVNPTLSYFMLTGEDADYNGMAKCYRNYLETSGDLVKTGADTGDYGITILGGAQVTDSFLGIPHDSTVAATTFTQAQEILTRLSEFSESKPVVRLLGYGDRGVNPGKLAGGFSFPSLYGSKAQRLDLEAYCSSQQISLFSDFDLVRFSRSGNGISSLNSSAKSATLREIVNAPFGTPQRQNLSALSYNLLRRSELQAVVAKLQSAADKQEISGISLMTLGHLSYSDFSDAAYVAKSNTQTEVTKAIEALLAGGHSVAGGPNSYSAIASTVVFDVPTDNGGNFTLDAEIPFYEMVFRGSKPIFGESVNLADDINGAVLRNLAYGSNLSFSVLYDYNTNFTETDVVYPGLGANKLYACDFEENAQFISDTLEKYDALYEKISGAGMVRYTMLSDTVTETVFDNGVTLYVNHGDTPADSPVGELAAFEVKY